MMITDDAWDALKLALPVGQTVRGHVTVHARFGFFVELDEHPSANAVVLAPDFTPTRAESDLFPPVGSLVEAEVLDHVDLTKQIRLRMGPGSEIGASD
ncbi:MAG: hypothetical protein ACRD2W_06065 [Acidimicrobiales bacterium]